MNLALYRRYRPETFADVVGQEHVTSPLMQALRTGRVNHAYLFSGPRGCGKTTSARILARCLNCEQGPTPDPCGRCPSCVDLARGGPGSLDVVEIDAASHGGVDDARDLRERAAMAPVRDRFKVYVIDEAHMVSPQGFNALLKLVEEPPEHVKFVFATTEPDKVLQTIRSRTHHYAFRLVPPDLLAGYLQTLCDAEQVPVGDGVLPLVVRAGQGSVRDSLSVLDQLMAGRLETGIDYPRAVALLGYTDAALLDDAVDALAADDGAAAFAVVNRVVESGHDPRRFVEDLLERLRDLIVVQAVGDAAAGVLRAVPADRLERMRTQAQTMSAARLSHAADLTNLALAEMVGASSPRIHLELLCARLLLTGPGGAAAPAPAPPAPGGSAAVRDQLRQHTAPPAPSGQSGSSRPGSGGQAAPSGQPAPERQTTGAPAPGPQRAPQPGPAAGYPVAAAQPGATAATPGAAAGPAPGPSGPADQPGPGAAEPSHAPAGSAPDQPGPAAVSSGPAAGQRAAASGSTAAEGPAVTSDAQPGPASEPAETDRAGGPSAAAVAAARSWDLPPAGHADRQGPATPQPPVQQPATQQPAGRPGGPAAGAAIDVTVLRQGWQDVMSAVRGRKRATWMVLEGAQVAEVSGTLVRLQFQSVGQAKGFGHGQHAAVLKDAIHSLFGVEVTVEAATGSPVPPSGPGPAAAATAPQAPPPPRERVVSDHDSSGVPFGTPPEPDEFAPPPDEAPRPSRFADMSRQAAAAREQAAHPEPPDADSLPSRDDPEAEDAGLVGQEVVERLLGGTVIDVQES